MDGLLTRRRADELEAALSGAVPAQRAELAADLAVVARLRDVGTALQPTPAPEFRDALRTRLMAVAAVQGVGETSTAAAPLRSAVSWRQRAATLAAGVTASVVAVSGVAVASSQAVPGDAFYGLKRTTEQLQLRLADGAREEGERHLQFAAERLEEAGELAADGDLSAQDTRRLAEALAAMDADTRAGSRLLTEDFRASRDAEPLQLLAAFADSQRRGLTALLPAVDGAGEDAVRASLALVAEVGTHAEELLLLVDCTAACDPTASAPVLPSVPLGSAASPAPCGCPTPVPPPSVAPPPAPATTAPDPLTTAPAPPAATAPSAPPSSAPASPAPSPSSGPLPGLPLPPLPTVPTLPVPDVSDPLAPLDPLLDPTAPVQVPPLTGSGGVVDGVTGVLTQVGPALVVGSTGGPAGLAVRWLQGLLR